jgi:general secretion pathway protein G
MRKSYSLPWGRALLCLLAATVAQAGQVDLKTTRLTQRRMTKIVFALEAYRKTCGSVPTTEMGLGELEAPAACAHAPFVKSVGKDAWSHTFVYESDGKTFKLLSLGRDGKEGGNGEDMDLLAR